MLDLYLRGIENKSLFDEAYLSHWTYTNVVKLALRLQHYQLAEHFIKENEKSLRPHFQEDAQHYSLAELYFYRQNFDLVLSHLNQLHFTDLYYHLGSRVLYFPGQIGHSTIKRIQHLQTQALT